jgi:hypothetical protein
VIPGLAILGEGFSWESVARKQRSTNVTIGEEFRSGSGVEFHLDREKGKKRKQGKRAKTTRKAIENL